MSIVACASGKARVPLDPVSQSSLLDGDATGIVEGCGNPPAVGIAYCRVQEGQNAGQSLFFIGPPAECDQAEACVFIKVWNNQSQLVWGGSIPKGKTRIDAAWNKLLGRDTFEVGARGFWTWIMSVYFRDPDGKERIATAQGDIVLRVFRTGYLPLHEVGSDPNFVWSWSENGVLFRMTSGLRSFLQRMP